MKTTLQLILVIFFISCKGVAIDQHVGRQYYSKGKDYKYDLSLNKDSSFVLRKNYFEVNSICKGKWQYLSVDTILLKCDEEELSAKLQSGYTPGRERKILVLSNRKLKLGKVVLKRKSE